ncbi:ArfGAP, partial [Thalassiosira pseudonana CCMP1335]
SGVIVEGWLYKKSSNRLSLNAWTRRWFILDKNGVYYLKDFMERVKVCDILLCTVREINSKAKGNSNLRWCFEIISPNSKSYMLQACGPNDFKMWVGGIRSCIGKITPRKFGRNGARGGTQTESISFDEGGDAEGNASGHGGARLALFDNDFVCADCGNVDPDWASLNLGVVLCIECSGVHRSLGVHVSKVRSLRLDTISEFEYKLLLELGNDKVNQIWEAGLHHQKGWTKPKGGATRRVKEEWIKSKYLWKGFVEYLPE